MKHFKQASIGKVTNKLVSTLEHLDKLKEIANRKNYSFNVTRLHKRVLEEYSLWSRKNTTSKLEDLKKDLTFIETQINKSDLDKRKIDLLMQKYGYGKSS